LGINTKRDSKSDLVTTEFRRYKVLLLNDDYTSMDFVISVLVELFHKSAKEAEAIMLAVHNSGKGVCGIYTYEIAETKVEQVHKAARAAGYPLRAVVEEM
jgi:ATP-dependent Clp protease adaptor protein ClpS